MLINSRTSSVTYIAFLAIRYYIYFPSLLDIESVLSFEHICISHKMKTHAFVPKNFPDLFFICTFQYKSQVVHINKLFG